MLLPYFVPEITPRVLKASPRWFGSEAFVAGKDSAAAARAVVEAQALSMRLHSDWIGEAMTTVLVTGGASKNRGLLRVLADVFQATIMPLSVSNSSALGGALRAAQGVGGSAWQNLYAQFCPPDRDLAVEPNPNARPIYQQLGATFEKHIQAVLSEATA
jgi:xylulokinase